MPALEQIPVIAENGVQVVINLATSASEGALPNEKELVEAYNIRYYNIPVDWEVQPLKICVTSHRSWISIKGKRYSCIARRITAPQVLLRYIGSSIWAGTGRMPLHFKKNWNPADYPAWEKFIEENLPAKQ